MNKYIQRIKCAWSVLRGVKEVNGIISADLFNKLMVNIEDDEGKMIAKYSERIYNIIEMAIPQEKIATMRKGVGDVFDVMVKSINLHIAHELDEINKIIHESPTAISNETKSGETAKS